VTGQDFLRAIIADPADDVVRLVYADWLAENGEEDYASFIRVQCELARLGPTKCVHAEQPITSYCTGCADHWPLRRRERELIDAHGYGWCDGLLGTGWKTRGYNKDSPRVRVSYGNYPRDTGTLDFTFRRGFVAKITCTLADWCGAECESCGGRGGYQVYLGHGNVDEDSCPDCRGAGRVNGHGPALVRAAPLERVTLAEWGGIDCQHCYRGLRVISKTTCDICHGLYDSFACIDWAKHYSKTTKTPPARSTS
jgi:uncharacterized protein (TIGR02996 family)